MENCQTCNSSNASICVTCHAQFTPSPNGDSCDPCSAITNCIQCNYDENNNLVCSACSGVFVHINGGT